MGDKCIKFERIELVDAKLNITYSRSKFVDD